MITICAFKGHSAAAQTIRNQGYHFARCGRCGTDLLEQDGKWAAAPQGFRIVWRSAAEAAPHTPAAVLTAADRDTAPQPPAPEPAERRAYRDRRQKNAELPAFLGGKDRRRSRDRRKGFGKRAQPLQG